MNIIEKVLQLKQDFDNVYAAGKAAGGGSGGNVGYKTTEVKITSNITNAKALFDIIFKDADLAHNLVAYLTHPQETDCIYNQITFLSNTDGVKRGVRYRDGVYSIIEIAANYDAAVTIGDIYTVVDLDEYVEDKDYEQGYEDGKKSVVDYSRYANVIKFSSFNLFGKATVELQLDEITELQNFVSLTSTSPQEYVNTTVKHFILNCAKPITNMFAAFSGSNSRKNEVLKRLTLNFETNQVTTFRNSLQYCSGLEIVDGQPIDCSGIDTTNDYALSGTFNGCSNLKEIRFVQGTISKSISFSASSLLSTDTIQSIIDGLADLSPRYYEVQQTGENTFENTGRLIENVISERVYTVDDNGLTIYYVDYGTEPPDIFSCMAYKEGGGTAQTLTLHSTVGNKLTDTQKATITAKNWELVY